MYCGKGEVYMDSYSLVKSVNGISSVSVEAKLLSKRKIFIEGEITSDLACNVVRKIMFLVMEEKEKPIDILIHSPGGDINAGLLIYDMIQSCKTPIRLFCIGKAYSMAAVLLACGNHGRYILPHSELMLHEPLLNNRVEGTSSSIKSISESLLEVKRKLNNILAKHTGKEEEEIEKATCYDHFFNPTESIEFGLADEIIGFDKMMEE